MLPNGWTVLAYHDVDPEPSLWRDWIGVHVTPDIFRGHVETFARHAELIDVSVGIRRLRDGEEFEKPYVSFWFDDGYRGVRKYALPILEEFGVTAAQAVNSRFASGQELFWRCKMARLHTGGLGEALADELAPLGCPKEDVRNWTLYNYQPAVLDVIDGLLEKIASSDEVEAVTRHLFEDVGRLEELGNRGWVLSNHTSAHQPVMTHTDPEAIRQAYGECEDWLANLGVTEHIWVVPFDPGRWETDKLGAWLKPLAGDAEVVRLLYRTNTVQTYRESGQIYRYMVMPTDRRDPLPLP